MLVQERLGKMPHAVSALVSITSQGVCAPTFATSALAAAAALRNLSEHSANLDTILRCGQHADPSMAGAPYYIGGGPLAAALWKLLGASPPPSTLSRGAPVELVAFTDPLCHNLTPQPSPLRHNTSWCPLTARRSLADCCGAGLESTPPSSPPVSPESSGRERLPKLEPAGSGGVDPASKEERCTELGASEIKWVKEAQRTTGRLISNIVTADAARRHNQPSPEEAVSEKAANPSTEEGAARKPPARAGSSATAWPLLIGKLPEVAMAVASCRDAGAVAAVAPAVEVLLGEAAALSPKGDLGLRERLLGASCGTSGGLLSSAVGLLTCSLGEGRVCGAAVLAHVTQTSADTALCKRLIAHETLLPAVVQVLRAPYYSAAEGRSKAGGQPASTSLAEAAATDHVGAHVRPEDKAEVNWEGIPELAREQAAKDAITMLEGCAHDTSCRDAIARHPELVAHLVELLLRPPSVTIQLSSARLLALLAQTRPAVAAAIAQPSSGVVAVLTDLLVPLDSDNSPAATATVVATASALGALAKAGAPCASFVPEVAAAAAAAEAAAAAANGEPAKEEPPRTPSGGESQGCLPRLLALLSSNQPPLVTSVAASALHSLALNPETALWVSRQPGYAARLVGAVARHVKCVTPAPVAGSRWEPPNPQHWLPLMSAAQHALETVRRVASAVAPKARKELSTTAGLASALLAVLESGGSGKTGGLVSAAAAAVAELAPCVAFRRAVLADGRRTLHALIEQLRRAAGSCGAAVAAGGEAAAAVERANSGGDASSAGGKDDVGLVCMQAARALWQLAGGDTNTAVAVASTEGCLVLLLQVMRRAASALVGGRRSWDLRAGAFAAATLRAVLGAGQAGSQPVLQEKGILEAVLLMLRVDDSRACGARGGGAGVDPQAAVGWQEGGVEAVEGERTAEEIGEAQLEAWAHAASLLGTLSLLAAGGGAPAEAGTMTAWEVQLVGAAPLLIKLLAVRRGAAAGATGRTCAHMVAAAAEALSQVLELAGEAELLAFGELPGAVDRLLEVIARLGGQVSSDEVSHLATAATSAASVVHQLIQRPELIEAVAMHKLTPLALTCLLEEHSYLRLRLLFPGLVVQGLTPPNARLPSGHALQAAEAAAAASIAAGGGATPGNMSMQVATASVAGDGEDPDEQASMAGSRAGGGVGARSQPDSEDVRALAAAVVLVVTQFGKGERLVRSSNLILGLTSMLKSESLGAQTAAVTALWALCQVEGGAELVGKPAMGAAKSLGALLRSPEPQACVAAAGTLSSLALCDGCRAAVGSTEGVITGLAAALGAIGVGGRGTGGEGPPEESRKPAAAAVGFFAYSAPLAARLASTEGMLAGLVAALECSQDLELQIYAAGALGNLANHAATQSLVAGGPGVARGLARLLNPQVAPPLMLNPQ
ncbi:hypothetical protein CYMTET_34483, partial [Cymbomonas tetramitiformis]